MSTKSTEETIVKTEDVLGGDPRISGHRIGVYDVVELVLEGRYSVQDVIRAVYPRLSEREVHAALAYYYDHSEEIREIEQEVTELMKRPEAIVGPDDVPTDLPRDE
jgi:uncharacterized protein (DUF433 family)